MKTKLVYSIITMFFLSATLISCHKKVNAEKGGIDIISNVYFDASKNLNKMQTFHLSKLNYSNENIIELIPDQEFPEIISGAYYIADSLCYKLDKDNVSKTTLSQLQKQKPILATQKKEGTLFLKESIPNYRNRRDLSDTVLFKKKYKRFEINSPWAYTRFYVYKTDTILPYSLYKHVEDDYNGRIERIDSYNKKQDIFVTLQLIPRKNWDAEANEFYSYNQYLINQSKAKKIGSR